MTPVDLDALDRQDMARLAGGHDGALNDLMERHAAPVFHFLCRMLGSEDDANDLAQESFVRVYRSRNSFKPDAKFSTWLFTIAANLARNQMRWRARHPNISLDAESAATEQSLRDTLPAPGDAPSVELEAHERAVAVRAAVARLPEEMRETLVLVEWEDKPVAEAAAILKVPARTVESRLYRARQLLRERLAKWL
jgi:RNA polymerase sigma-70 factor (ECF subfamily)